MSTSVAERTQQVVTWPCDGRPYSETLRALVFRDLRLHTRLRIAALLTIPLVVLELLYLPASAVGNAKALFMMLGAVPLTYVLAYLLAGRIEPVVWRYLRTRMRPVVVDDRGAEAVGEEWRAAWAAFEARSREALDRVRAGVPAGVDEWLRQKGPWLHWLPEPPRDGWFRVRLASERPPDGPGGAPRAWGPDDAARMKRDIELRFARQVALLSESAGGRAVVGALPTAWGNRLIGIVRPLDFDAAYVWAVVSFDTSGNDLAVQVTVSEVLTFGAQTLANGVRYRGDEHWTRKRFGLGQYLPAIPTLLLPGIAPGCVLLGTVQCIREAWTWATTQEPVRQVWFRYPPSGGASTDLKILKETAVHHSRPALLAEPATRMRAFAATLLTRMKLEIDEAQEGGR